MGYLYAFDIAMDRTGITIFDLKTLKEVLVTSIETNSDDSHGERLHCIAKKVLELTDKYTPEVLSLERGFTQYNNSTQAIFKVHGVINFMFYDLPQFYYPPKTIKAKIIHGDADKNTVRKAIMNKFSHLKFKNNDESDSYAIGLTYLIDKKLIDWEKPDIPVPKKKRRKRPKKTE